MTSDPPTHDPPRGRRRASLAAGSCVPPQPAVVAGLAARYLSLAIWALQQRPLSRPGLRKRVSRDIKVAYLQARFQDLGRPVEDWELRGYLGEARAAAAALWRRARAELGVFRLERCLVCRRRPPVLRGECELCCELGVGA